MGLVDENVYYLASDFAAIAASSTLCAINHVPVPYDTRISIMSHEALKSLTIIANAVESREAGVIDSIVIITDITGKLVAKAKLRYQLVKGDMLQT
jgi:hypothetical protein